MFQLRSAWSVGRYGRGCDSIMEQESDGMTDGLTVVKNCTTCRRYKYLKWLDEHLCKYPGLGGTLTPEDVLRDNCPGWEPMEVDL